MPEPAGPPFATSVTVEEAKEADADLLQALTRLVPQLSSAPPPSTEELDEIVRSPTTVLFVARDAAGSVVGSLTLALFRVPTGLRAWIEDVVVDQASRGAGAGTALVRAALTRAAEAGARTVDLTSRPSREDANRLYQQLGFVQRRTNVYRRELGASPS
ncbi:MAG TPA: GNAT family N-acetyltransferase [Acidimicrobiales bacterium]|nr:GNAT family N-acetyltransferase [Acidimicrobiales bacterium]